MPTWCRKPPSRSRRSDFLKPSFQGKIVPPSDSMTQRSYNFDMIEIRLGLHEEVHGEPALFRRGESSRRRRPRVAGESLVSFDNSALPSGKLKTAMSEKDKTPVFFTAAGILAKAPHPNAAKLLVTWMLSKEQQGRNPAAYSPRRDVPPPAGLPPLTSPRFANGYHDFLGDGTKLAALRKRFEVFTGPITGKSTGQ